MNCQTDQSLQIINAEKKAPDLLKLTIPILIEAILHMMLGFVDVFMLSRYNDLAASGVNAANQVITGARRDGSLCSYDGTGNRSTLYHKTINTENRPHVFLELGRACNLTIIPCLRGSGDVKFPTLWAIFSNLIIGFGGAHLLAIQCQMGIHGLWVAMALDEVFRAVVMLIRWNGSQWKNKRITTQAQEEKKEPAEQAEAVLCVLRA